MKDEIQSQQAGDDSVNVQAKNIIINAGVTATEARDIALDIYRANFLKLSEAAASLATERVTRFTESFLEKLYAQDKKAIEQFETPALQMSLLAAQRECAKSDEASLQDSLCNLLIARANEPHRGLKQIAIEEAISVTPKLTEKQLDILTLNFIIKDCYYYVGTWGLQNYVRQWLSRFVVAVEYQSPEISHLEFTGCAKLPHQSYDKPFPMNIIQSYPGLFTNGFELIQYEQSVGSDEKFTRLLKTSERDPGKVQLIHGTYETLNVALKSDEYADEEKKRVREFIKKGAISHKEMQEDIIKIDSATEPLFKPGSSSIFNLELNPVGVAVALANFQRKVGYSLPWPYRMRNA